MQKFFISNNQLDLNNNIAYIEGEDVNHIKNVLRYKEGKIIEIGTDIAENYECKIIELNKDSVKCEICKKLEESKESNIYINIIQGLPKSEKMELIIQKCTELGVMEITPLELSRCVVKLNGKDEKNKVERWQKIAETAAKQCKRSIIPKINKLYNIKNIYNLLSEYDIILVAYEDENKNTLKDELNKLSKNKSLKIAIVIGPEGGIDSKEIEYFKQMNSKIITLGNRILRTETVGIALTSIIMYEFGDLG